jgi:hypothetical protein
MDVFYMFLFELLLAFPLLFLTVSAVFSAGGVLAASGILELGCLLLLLRSFKMLGS